MFIDASVRNGFDTLKTILKLFLFKIYTWVRRLSGAVGTAAIQCGVNITLTFSPEVLLVHKSDGTRFSFPEQKDCPHQLHHHHHHHYHCAEPLDSHAEVSFSQGAFRSTVQSSLVCTNTQSVRSDQNMKMFHPTTFQTVQGVYLCHQAFILHTSSVWSSSIQFNWIIFNGIYILLIYTNSFSPGPKTEKKTFGQNK